MKALGLAILVGAWGVADVWAMQIVDDSFLEPVKMPEFRVLKMEVVAKIPPQYVVRCSSGVNVFTIPPLPVIEVQTADGLIDLFGSEQNYRVAIDAERVKLVRLRGDMVGEAEYFETEEVEMSEVDGGILQTLLTLDAAYDWKKFPDCMPEYGARVKFLASGKEVAVDLCLECCMARVVVDGKTVSVGNFSYVSEKIEVLVATYFPEVMR